ncbi:MAG: radical SAM protein [Candidatus Eremiobacteraeota bacterium]|nr:radical SAM protein [Candidatus Eremiobacteraeota bacterium]
MKNRKVLLIEPPFYRLHSEHYGLWALPLWMGYLAGAVTRKARWECRLFNADYVKDRRSFDVEHLTGEGFSRYVRLLGDMSAPQWDEIRELIAREKPGIVGVSVKSPSLASAKAVARSVKAVGKAIVTVAGGPHATAAPGELLGDGLFDFCIAGEGEKAFVSLLEALGSGESAASLKSVVAIHDGSLHASPREAIEEDLDALGFPHEALEETLLGYQHYGADAFSHLMASRGCPRRCFFCGSRQVWGTRVRCRSPRHVVSELRALKALGIRHFHFDDDTFGVSPRYLKDLCSAINEGLPGISWGCETHVSLVDKENLVAMKKAGCTVIQIGIESGSDTMLRGMNKGFTAEEALRACGLIRDMGIRLEAFFMAGLPGETEEMLGETISMVRSLECDKVIYSIFTPYRGTEAYNYCREKGLIGDRYDPSLHSHQSPLNCFSGSMTLERFRERARELESIVAEKNRYGAYVKASPPDPSPSAPR